MDFAGGDEWNGAHDGKLDDGLDEVEGNMNVPVVDGRHFATGIR